MKKPLLGAITLVAIMIASQALVPLKAMAAADNPPSLGELKKENARLREELAALRERDRLRSEISTVRARVERQDSTSPAAAVPTSVRKAYAADKPVYKAVPYVQAPAARSWNGFYVGLNAGAREDQVSATTTSVVGFAAGFPPFTPDAGFPTPSLSQSAWSFRIGPYVGYNWQIGSQWLVGIEGDWAWANKTATFVGAAYPNTTNTFATPGSPDIFSVKTAWDASIRARVGFLASPNLLLYLAGGPSWMKVETTSACVAGGPSRNCFAVLPPAPGTPSQLFTQPVIANSSTKLGWSLGGGVEAMFAPGWIMRAEYRYSDYGTISNTDRRQFTPAAAAVFGQDGYNVSYNVHVRTNLATVGIARKFDW
jgi:outer membrane immunogenic protein